MKITLGYKKLMEAHGLKETELSKKARVGIAAIDAILRGVNMAESKALGKGKTYTVSASIMDKIEANDEWVAESIADQLEGTQTTAAEIPNTAAEVVAEIKAEEPAAAAPAAAAPVAGTPAPVVAAVETPAVPAVEEKKTSVFDIDNWL